MLAGLLRRSGSGTCADKPRCGPALGRDAGWKVRNDGRSVALASCIWTDDRAGGKQTLKPQVRVLIADDDEATREALGEFLSGEGFEVVGGASNGAEAVERASQLRPDVVLMDLRMPRMDGLEATAFISANLPETQVVILTAFSDQESSRATGISGAASFVEKDGPLSVLVEAVRTAAVIARSSEG